MGGCGRAIAEQNPSGRHEGWDALRRFPELVLGHGQTETGRDGSRAGPPSGGGSENPEGMDVRLPEAGLCGSDEPAALQKL